MKTFSYQPTTFGLVLRATIVSVPALIAVGIYGNYWNTYLKLDQSIWALCGATWMMLWFQWIVRIE